MRLTTKITGITGLLVGLLVAMVAYQVTQVRTLAAVSHRLSTTVFSAAGLELELERQRARTENLTRRLWVLGDPDYVSGVERAQADFEGLMLDLAALPLSQDEAMAAQEVRAAWRAYRESWSRWTGTEGERGDTAAESQSVTQSDVLQALDRVAMRTAELATTTERSIHEMQADAEDERREVERVSWLAAIVALAVTLPIVAFLLQSIRGPLRRLVRGTRAVAAGDFPDRVEVSGGEEIEELAASFNNMVDRLQEVDELKQGFVAHISHELRTPLVAMRETTEAMLEELAGPVTPRQRRLLELHLEGSERLRRMVERLLDLTRMEAGAMEYDREIIDLVELVRDAVEALTAGSSSAVRIELRIPEEAVPVRGDRERLRQVVDNLVVNALKYSDDDAPVCVEVDAGEGVALLVVEDEGPGVPREHRQLIFQKFHRASTGLPTGFGLGLAICREIVAAHDGTLWVEDREPVGSRFCVLLARAERVAA